MKKRLFLLFIILVTSNSFAQPVLLSGDLDGNPYLADPAIEISSLLPLVTISGEIQWEKSLTILPTSTNQILIKASEAIYGLTALGGSKGTVMRPKPGIDIGTGKIQTDEDTIKTVITSTGNEIEITSDKSRIIGYTIYDLTGKIIIREEITATIQSTVSTSSLQKAVYIIRIDFENHNYKTLKFIKN